MENNNEVMPVTPVNQEPLFIEPQPEIKSPEINTSPEAEKMPDVNIPAEGKKKKKISVKAIIIILLVLAIIALVYFFKNLLIVAVVNGTPISRLTVVSKAEKASGKNILDMLITMKLINDEAQKKGISATKDEIDAEAKKVEEQIKLQGLTLDQALAQQGVSPEDFQNQMAVQIKLEKLLDNKIEVSDAEIDQYITNYKITVPEGQESTFRDQIKDQLRQEKLSKSAGEYIDNLRSAASIYYFVNY